MRNTSRGFRSEDAMERRKQRRSYNRLLSRRQHRANSPDIGPRAQDPRVHSADVALRFPLATPLHIASYNVTSLKISERRKELENYMTQHHIDILCLQETQINTNSRETRPNYHWYFSGYPRITRGQRFVTGVGIVYHKRWRHYINDIRPINDRMMLIQLNGTVPITIITVYAPPAGRTEAEKE
eukprot:9414233-Prorocentrum_lima.AAC.1